MSATAGTDDCNSFEPQNYLRDRCKKCFRLRAKHGSTVAAESTKTMVKPRRPATICGGPTPATAAAVGLLAGGVPPAHAVPLNVTGRAPPVDISHNHNITVQNYNNSNAAFNSNNVGNVNMSKSRPPERNSSSGLMTTRFIVSEPSAQTTVESGSRPKSMTASTDNITADGIGNGVALKFSTSFGKEERRGSRRSSAAGAVFEDDDAADSISLASYKTANSKGVSSTKSMESVNSTTDSRSMVTAMSGGSTNDDERAVTPTDVTEFLDQDLAALRKENTRLQDQVLKLKNERQRWTQLRRRSKANPDEPADERLAEAESLLQEYREENSLLKSELRAIQDSAPQGASEKLRSAESRCEELTQKNSELQRNVDELQQEIEEMQDQYREEEIDEFRELQRDLEQNAKNCRILQFKLRKSERQRDNLVAEKNVLAAKLRDLQQQFAVGDKADNVGTGTGSGAEASKEARVRELESELRIAKEVSVRLHNELESAEDKRYKLEDEIFYYKEKLREMQTQNKWRETRNRGDKLNKRHGNEDKTPAAESAVGAESRDAAKELHDVLERETDLREQLKFSEEDLHRTQMRLKEAENENEELLQKLVGLSEGKSILSSIQSTPTAATKTQRAPMIRSFSEDSQREATCSASAYLRAHTQRADGKLYKTFATAAGKKTTPLGPTAKDSATNSAEMEKDIAKLLKTITELEQKNGELQIQLQKSEAKLLALQSQHVSASENRGLSVELRKEQELRKELQDELIEYKQLIAKSDNNKLIAMATKVEILTNQLKALTDRCETLHRKAAKDRKDDKYTENLKTRCDNLERQLAEQKARQIFQSQSGQPADAIPGKAPTADEIEQCCVLLASVDAQASRIAKQLDKMDLTQKEERRRSLSKDTYAVMVADFASVMAELKVLHKLLETHKICSKREMVNGMAGGDEISRAAATTMPLAEKSCGACADKSEEIVFYKKKNKELTNQILQTEDRWTAEIERQGVDHQSKIDKLKNEVKQLRASLREQTQAADARAQAFGEKDKLIDEMSAKLRRVESEMAEKLRVIQELEKDQRELKEWETRHKKLESLYNKEKQKFDAEKARIKTETSVLKKRTDDALAELTRLRDGHQRREILWTEERTRLEQEIAQLKSLLTETRDDPNNNGNNIDQTTRTVPIRTVNYRTAAVAAAARSGAKTDEQTERLRQKCLALEKQNEEVEHQLQSARTENARLQAELTQNRQVWQRERDTVTHKSRQDEKIRSVEIEALQQKFTSRMNIMETSNKSLHSQLVQTRRDRDTLRDSSNANEKRLHEQIRAVEAERAKFAAEATRLADIEKRFDETLDKVKRLSSELALAKETHRADKKLWDIEKERYNSENFAAGKSQTSTDAEGARNRIVDNALKAAEDVQKQYSEYQKFYNEEVGRLKAKIKDLNNQIVTNESAFQRRAKYLTEQIKILDIDQKNLVQLKEMQADARDAMQAEQSRLTQLLQQAEIHRISRRYRIASIVEQLNSLLEKNTASAGLRSARQSPHSAGTVQLISIINQLNALKENDGVIQGNCPTAIGETLSEADTTAPSDTTSQCSASVRSTPRANPSAQYRGGAAGVTQFGALTTSQRSGSVESNTTWDSRLLDYTARSVSPTKRVFYADTLHSNKNKPNQFVRMGSSMCQETTYGSSNAVNGTPSRLNLRQMRSMNTLMSSVEDNSADVGGQHTRMNSTGTNVLYKIRRQELSKGTSPSVRSIAQAFESINMMDKARQKASPGAQLRGFFSMRKSRSVDNEAKKQKELERSMMSAINVPLGRQTDASGTGSTGGLSANDNGENDELSASFTATLPRGGRNPFKNMGAKIVDRVRRSLSRSSRRDESVEKCTVALKTMTAGNEEIMTESERVDQSKS